MNSKVSFFIILTLIFMNLNAEAQKQRIVLIHTEFGDMKVKLYNETPQHRDNFIKLASEKFFDGTIFHRVIKEFMIQGGDPQSKNASASAMLGSGGPGYTIPAEILPTFCHKKGALSAARQGDNVNPEKKSSGSQFYVVQGKVYKNEELAQIEQSVTLQNMQKYFPKFINKPEHAGLRAEIDSLQKAKDQAGLNALNTKMVEMIMADKDFTKFHYTDEQRKIYTTVGGTPFLDNEYTVFGEVIEGLDVIDKIAAQKTNPQDRPLKDVVMTITVVE